MRLEAGIRPPSGLTLLSKPEGITSFQALSPIKRALGTGKVGHAGTLDRFARGLLVALVGPYARIALYAMAGEKRYRGLVSFGSETDTLDPEGRVIATSPAPSEQTLLAALPAFRGRVMQRPPAYSAVHVDGKRAYKVALEGGEPNVKERAVEIRSLELLSYRDGEALIDLRCSSGTYVRSLARDLAAACGSRAHLKALERLEIGPFRVEDAVSPDAFDPRAHLRELGVDEAAALGLRAVGLEGDKADLFARGGKIESCLFTVLDGGPGAAGSDAAVFKGTSLLGIARLEAPLAKYLVVMPRKTDRTSIGMPE